MIDAVGALAQASSPSADLPLAVGPAIKARPLVNGLFVYLLLRPHENLQWPGRHADLQAR